MKTEIVIEKVVFPTNGHGFIWIHSKDLLNLDLGLYKRDSIPTTREVDLSLLRELKKGDMVEVIITTTRNGNRMIKRVRRV